MLSLFTQASSPEVPDHFSVSPRFPSYLPATAGWGDLETLSTLSPFQVSPLSPQISLGSLFGSGSSLGQVLPKVEFPPKWTTPPSAPEWTPFQAPREFPGRPRSATGRELRLPLLRPPGCLPSAVGSGKGAGLQVQVLSDAGNLLSLWRLGTPSPRGSPESSPWRGGAPAVPHASFQPLQLQLQGLLNEPLPARGRSGRVAVACLERTSEAPGTGAGKAPRPLPRSHPARRGRESPRGSSHPRGFSPVAATLLRERSRLSCFPPGWSARGSCSCANAGGKGR